MSNFLAIATVTETLRQLLDGAVGGDVPGASATSIKPGNGATPAGPSANIYLYRVSPNESLRNADLPTRRADGLIQERPRAALTLHYLISFNGNDAQLEPQRMLGSTVRTLHTFAVLSRQMIEGALSSTQLGFLAASDLVEQPELVKFMPEHLSLDDLSKLWSVFFQTPYLLSVAYEATVVFVEADEVIPSGMPVQRRNLRVMPISQPRIERVRSASGPSDPIVVGTTLVIEGHRLQGEVTMVRIGGELVAPVTATGTAVTVVLEPPDVPASALKAGVQGAQVVHEVLFDTPSDPHRGSESNMAPFVLRPTIVSISAAGGTITVESNPPVRNAQRVALLLNEHVDADARAFTIHIAPFDTDETEPEFPLPGAVSGEFFARLQIDGVESPLDLDPASPNFGPTVVLP